jgi:hypothetical protein
VSKLVSIGVRSRPVADASGASVLGDQGAIGRPGTARPTQALSGTAGYLPKKNAGCWTRRRAFAQVRQGSNIQLHPYPLVAATYGPDRGQTNIHSSPKSGPAVRGDSNLQ